MIDTEKCQGCGLCVSVCKVGVIVVIDNKATIIEMMDSDWSMMCEAVCPNRAIACPFEIVLKDKQ